MIKLLYRIILLMLISSIAIAAPQWHMISDQSKMTFTATQNNAPVTGQFKKFSGDIVFDPANLKSSHVKVIVDMNSVTTAYAEVADTLKTSDWFDVKTYSESSFSSNEITKIADNKYQAKGMLTIRDKTLPVTVTFSLEKYSSTDASVKGETTIKRRDFDVGRNEWAKTDEIKDDVLVQFVVIAKAG